MHIHVFAPASRLRRLAIPAFFSAAALLSLALAACGGGSSAKAEPDPTPVADSNVIVVKMFDNSFKPNDITVQAGTTVTFELPNVGILPHNMHIASARGVYRESDWLSQPSVTNGGQTGKLTWAVPAEPGKYLFRCDIHEAEMTGTITVE